MSITNTAHDLEQDGNSGRGENETVDVEKEILFIESHSKIKCIIRAIGSLVSGRKSIGQGAQISLDEFFWGGLLSRCRICDSRALVSKDGRVDAICEG